MQNPLPGVTMDKKNKLVISLNKGEGKEMSIKISIDTVNR